MRDFWSYSLDDLLLFSPRVYYRMLELHNQALWPVQLISILLGLALVFLVVRTGPDRIRVALVICGAAWLWIAWSFFWQRYATINWAAAYIAPVAAFEGLLLIGFGALKGSLDLGRTQRRFELASASLLFFAVVGYPFIAAVMGRPWFTAEVFAIAPDPTAIASIAVLTFAPGSWRWILMPIPLLWCTVSGLTLWTMKTDDYFVVAVCAVLGLALTLLQGKEANS